MTLLSPVLLQQPHDVLSLFMSIILSVGPTPLCVICQIFICNILMTKHRTRFKVQNPQSKTLAMLLLKDVKSWSKSYSLDLKCAELLLLLLGPATAV